MYRDNALHVLRFNNYVLVYCTDRNLWEREKLLILIITNNDINKITKRNQADLYNHEYNRQVADDVARTKGRRVKLK